MDERFEYRLDWRTRLANGDLRMEERPWQMLDDEFESLEEAREQLEGHKAAMLEAFPDIESEYLILRRPLPVDWEPVEQG